MSTLPLDIAAGLGLPTAEIYCRRLIITRCLYQQADQMRSTAVMAGHSSEDAGRALSWCMSAGLVVESGDGLLLTPDGQAAQRAIQAQEGAT